MDSPILKDYAAFLLRGHAEESARQEWQQLQQLDPPIMTLLRTYPEPAVIEGIIQRSRQTLTAIAAGRGHAHALERLRQWVNGELPNLTPDRVEASDIVLTTLAEKKAMLAFVGLYTTDTTERALVSEEVERYYAQYRSDAMEVFLKTKAEAKLKSKQSS